MADRDPRWRILSSRVLLDRWWLRLRVDHVRLPGGAEMEEYHVAEYPDWTLAIPVTAGGEVVMVEQYRHGLGRVGLEFPAGVVHEGEDPQLAASRELREETGFAVEHWVRLPPLAIEPARHTNYAHLFVGRGASRVSEPDLDATEEMRTRLVPASELEALVASGEIHHGIHVAALLLAFRKNLL